MILALLDWTGQLATALYFTAILAVGAWGFWRIHRRKSIIPPAWGIVGIVGLLLVFLLVAGCSWIDQGAEHVSQLIDTRQEKQQSGWEWENWLTCWPRPKMETDSAGDPVCILGLAPTMEACATGSIMEFRFPAALSGISRRSLVDLCRESAFGERWPRLDGILTDDGAFLVRDANRGSKTP